jgi:superfamily II DNA or RNA helicase
MLKLTESPQYSPDKLAFVNQGLNEAQRQAVSTCLRSQDVAMIHGPPGTGKTTTVVEFIIQTVRL